MKYYCGIDLHSIDCFLCVIDDNERILVSNKLPNDLKMILEKLCQFDSMPIVAVESTLNWYWLVDGLQEAGLEVKLAYPLGLFMITGAKDKMELARGCGDFNSVNLSTGHGVHKEFVLLAGRH